MKYILLASSTAGHICPCLETADFLKKHRRQFVIISEKKKIPLMLLKDNENVVFIDELKKYKSYISFLKILKQYDKECVFLSFGGRLSTVFPMLYILGYRNLYIYELNRIMGKIK